MSKSNYGRDERYADHEPGNLLRARLSDVDVADVDVVAFDTLSYTAYEYGIIPYDLSLADVQTLLRLVKLASELSDAEIGELSL